MRWITVAAALLLMSLTCIGCTQSRTVTISAKPPDSQIFLDDIAQGRGPITRKLEYVNPGDVHHIRVTRKGFEQSVDTITLEKPKSPIVYELSPKTREVFLRIEPGPAYLTIDNQRVSEQPVSSWSVHLDMSVDSHDDYIVHTAKAERQGFQPTQISMSYPDPDRNYLLNLQPMRKDLSITSSPGGATVYFDDDQIGTTPLRDPGRAFPVNPSTNQFEPHKIRLSKAGYEDVEADLGWDDAKTDYHFELKPHSKTVRIITDPADAEVRIEGQVLQRDKDGVAYSPLQFLPINEAGELRTFDGSAVKTDHPDEWQPAKFAIGWDDGKTTYNIALKEILTRKVPLLTAEWTHDVAWSVKGKLIESIGMKGTADSDERPRATQITHLPKGSFVDSLSVSPDGQQLVFCVLVAGKDPSDLHSQILAVRTDGSGGMDSITDGKSLDLMPTYSPDGAQIAFASNRGGKRMNIWQVAAQGASSAMTLLTSGDKNDLWPSIDSDPRPRLFYQSMLDNRPEPRLFSVPLGNMLGTDLQTSGMEPRVSPRNDTIVYSYLNDATEKCDIFRMPAGGGAPQNLTGTPDIDEHGAVWNRDGTKIAFTSDRGIDQDKRHNFDIWIMDMNDRGRLTQVTDNGAQDDCPAWDPTGNYIYFRSNRGGDWNIWRIAVK